MLKIYNLLRDMKAVSRWSQATCLKEESTLEHTGFVAIYALRLAYKYDADIAEVLTKAVVHDMEETITGDITTPMKYYNPEITLAVKKIEAAAAQEISIQVFYGRTYDMWEEAKDLSTDTGCIIYLADAAASAYKIWEEVELGNKTFHKYTNNILVRLCEVRMELPEKYRYELEAIITMLRGIK